MISKSIVDAPCHGVDCGFAESGGDLGCTSGGSCFEAMMLEASESKFHDARLVEATQKINDILASIPKDPQGRQLSFLHTNLGTMLAWVRHDMDVPDSAIKADSPNDLIIESLGLVNPPYRA